MKKVYQLEDLDCANCAAKMEEAIRKLDGVISAEVNFIMQKLTIEAEDEHFDEILTAVTKAVKKVEPDCTIRK